MSLEAQNPQNTRIYLDHAATSFPKPPGVMEAMITFASQIGANAGRGGYEEAYRASAIIATCRRNLARLFNAPHANSIVFTNNCTDALNIAINGLVDFSRRQHFICTAMDHNSVLRPLHALVERQVADLTIIAPDPTTWTVDPDDVRRAIRPDTRLIVVPHASNVTGALQPVEAIGRIARGRGVLFLIDAAQTAGHVPIDLQAQDVDLLAVPGHKGLQGPLGTGALYVRPGVEQHVRPLRTGGTGSASESLLHPTAMPDRYEAGSANTLGLAGLNAGLEWILNRGVVALRQHEVELMRAFLDATGAILPLRVFGPKEPEARVGVFTFELEGFEPAELAMVLESQFGMQVRSGLHCSPLAHQALGTAERGGAVRASFGPATSLEQVTALAEALDSIAALRA